MNVEQFSSTATTSFYSNEMLTGNSRRDPEKVAGLFEALFYRSMLEQARNSAEEDPLFGSFQMSQVKGMFDDELANHMGMMGNLGIAEMIKENIQNKTNALPPMGLLKQPIFKENG